VASLLIGVLIVPRTWRLLREAVDVLLEAAPKAWTWVRCAAHRGPQRCGGLHDLHAWTITSGLPVLSAHSWSARAY